MELADLWSSIAHRWRVVVAFLALGLLGALAIVLFSPTKYAATSQVFVGTKASTGSDAYAASIFATNRVQSYATIADTPLLLQPVIDTLHLKTTPAKLADDVHASVVSGTVVIDVTAEASTGQQAEQIAGAVADQLVAESARLENEQLTKKQEKAGLTAPPQLFRASILGAPSPATKASPRTTLDVVAGGLIGLLVGLGVASMRGPVQRRREVTDLHVEEASAA